ncbi:stemmadenine O-acetyltransferase-like [Punica granatum]|uniref:Uncharacterized protein n=2 Tax=Punica granatum TaxID=22663 RepID=A0A218WU33_PUNGR|nr:stemmadenine O-acetyltransferase-like [Punica granatum]OWM76173.1 hypothetical protein CDL15_Pgr009819 [Punica granatum]PKI77056.1 hypothetical protein CRG98_002559 [Punica granatum]
MMIEVQSIDTIKPSSPTPNHLPHHELSFLDQISPPIFMPLILFFLKDDLISNTERCETIKLALSEALTRFYPLAGRVKENRFVDCNDEGAHYVEARVRCRLSDILENPNPQLMNKLLPVKLHVVSELGMVVQVNLFDCGGLGISLCLSHKIADALSFFTFLNSWAAIARGDAYIISPCFDSASLFPPISISGYPGNSGITTGIITRRFVFEAASIAGLQAKYTNNDSRDRGPTRVEALSAFIWSRYVASTGKGSGDTTENKIYTLLHAVNLRTRMEPPLSERNFGNISRIAITIPSTDAIEGGRLHEIVNQVREAIRQVDAEYVRKLQQGDGHLNFLKERYAKVSKGEVIPFSCTSLCRFPMYEADFGWGKPAWVASATLPFKNVVVFLDTKSGDGIEAWCNFKEEDMACFEKDEELLSYVSPNSSVQI